MLLSTQTPRKTGCVSVPLWDSQEVALSDADYRIQGAQVAMFLDADGDSFRDILVTGTESSYLFYGASLEPGTHTIEDADHSFALRGKLAAGDLDGDGLDAHFPTGTNDAQGNFAAICNEYF